MFWIVSESSTDRNSLIRGEKKIDDGENVQMSLERPNRIASILFADHCYMSKQSMSKLENLARVRWAVSDREKDLVEETSEAEVIVSEYARITRRIIDSAPNLKGIIAYGAGFNHIDVDAASDSQIFVTNCRGANSEAVAELAISLMLALLRNLNKCDQYVRNRKWDIAESGKMPVWTKGRELCGKTLGIVGIGEIGRRIARICGKGFDMKILATDPFVTKEQALQFGAELVDLETLLKSSDVVTVHVPLGAKTKSLIGAKEIALMKESAIIVNTSRGSVVDESALADALGKGKIAGAGLDVFQQEPIPLNSPLLELDGTCLTPHVGGVTYEALDAVSDVVAEEATRIMRGEIPRNLINRSKLVIK